MKKLQKNTKIKENKWLFFFVITILLIICLIFNKEFDNDLWYLLSEGKYIFQNGIYHVDPLSMHSGLEIVVQNWLSATLFYVIYNLFGQIGILTMILITFFFICLLLYKICMLISEQNYFLSLITTFMTSLFLTFFFIVSRPQILSYVVLLSLIYVLELYIKTENKKYLVWIPILSLIEINMHASLWWMIFLFSLPYIIDSFNCPALKLQGYKKKPLIIALIIAFLVGFINPYGYKAITFIFSSYGDKFMHLYINELLPFNIRGDVINIQMFFLFIIIGLIYIFFREGKIRIRYLCLFCGTLLLGFMSIKGFSNFILVAIFPLAYFFKDIFPKNILNFISAEKSKKIFQIGTIFLTIVFIGLFIIKINTNLMENKAESSMRIISEVFEPQSAKIYSSFNNGGYVEFMGYKPYIDPRAEVFLKKNNKKEDLFKEFYQLQNNTLNIEKFLKKYEFDALLIDNNDFLYTKLHSIESYTLIHKENDFKVYIKSELLKKEEFNKYNKIYEFIS